MDLALVSFLNRQDWRHVGCHQVCKCRWCSIPLRLQRRWVLIGVEMLRTGKTILVVEDYADTQEMLKFLLEGAGFKVLTAKTGRDALAAAVNTHIDLVLTDFDLPDTSGPTVVRQLNARLKHVPTIMLTAYDGFEYRNRAAEAGCDAYVVKPPNFDTLLAIIDRLLLVRQAKREMQFRAS